MRKNILIKTDKDYPAYLEEKYNKSSMEDCLIGSRYGSLIVVGVCGIRQCGTKEYYVVCASCNTDPELFPSPFITRKSSLVKGCKPCFCSKNSRMTDEQHVISIKRLQPELNNCIIEVLNTRTGTNKDVKFTCDKCLKDEWVKLGCTSTFYSTTNSLKSGKLPCRCSRSRHSEKDYLLFYKSLVEAEGCSFISAETFKGIKTKINYTCQNGHQSSNSIASWKNGHRCRYCGKGFGLYKDRILEEDNLYILKLYNKDYTEVFYKVGRSFDVKERVKSIRKESGYNLEVLDTFTSTHSYIFYLEKLIHKYLRSYYYTPSISFGGMYECYTEDIIDYINNEDILCLHG